MENSQNQVPEEIQIPKQIQTRNVWNSDDVISISGINFETIVNFIGFFRPVIMAIDATVTENQNAGIIKTQSFDENGNALSDEFVQKVYEEMAKRSMIPMTEPLK